MRSFRVASIKITKNIMAVLFTLTSYLSNCQVQPIVPGQSLWCITQRIGETTDTILEKVMSLLDCPCTGTTNVIVELPCQPTAISQTSGAIVLSVAGNYCLANDFTGTISILGNCISLDLNNRCLNGTLAIQGNDIKAFNGFILPEPSITSTPSAGLSIVSSTNVEVTNCILQCGTSSVVSGTGRNGVFILTCTNIVLNECNITGEVGGSGNVPSLIGGGDSGSAVVVQNGVKINILNSLLTGAVGGFGGTFATTAAGGAGGDGLRLTNAELTYVYNCILSGGKGGQGEIDVPAVSGPGGSGGYGINIRLGTINTVILNSMIVGANGGDVGGSPSAQPGGNGGYGVFLESDTTVKQNKISYCRITSGNAGAAGGLGGSDSNGADGVRIGMNAQNTEVSHCIIDKTGVGIGASGLNGIAINDLNTGASTEVGGASSIFANFAYHIANGLTRYVVMTGIPSPFPNGINAITDGSGVTNNSLNANFYYP